MLVDPRKIYYPEPKNLGIWEIMYFYYMDIPELTTLMYNTKNLKKNTFLGGFL